MGLQSIRGLPIIDGKRAIKVEVLPADIKAGSRKDSTQCAFAKACQREMTSVKEVLIHLGRVYLRRNDKNWERYRTPSSLRDEIITFDKAGIFQEGTFTLTVPHHATTGKRQGGNTTSVAKKAKRSRHKKRAYRLVTNVRAGIANRLEKF
jgi:hypothetical protein